MAITITWKLDIIPISYANKSASIQATRTEVDSVTLTTIVNVYNIARAVIDTVTMANNVPILNEIWEKHQKRLADDIVKSNFISSLESAGKANLEARE